MNQQRSRTFPNTTGRGVLPPLCRAPMACRRMRVETPVSQILRPFSSRLPYPV